MSLYEFMDPHEPNFVWNNINAARDMGCIIESEIPEISPNMRYETSELVGRSGELHETFGDYEAYDLQIKNITIPYENLNDVKKWLRGSGKLITHNDYDKYRECICTMSKPVDFENEWGVFYTFFIVFMIHWPVWSLLTTKKGRRCSQEYRYLQKETGCKIVQLNQVSVSKGIFLRRNFLLGVCGYDRN